MGIPASVQQFSMALMMLIINKITESVGGTDGVAIVTAGWRVVTIATLPLLGMATAVVSVTAAAYGNKNYKKLNTAYIYAIKLGVIIEAIIAISTFLLAPLITVAFTYAPGSSGIAEGIIEFLRIVCVFYPAVAFGMFSSSMFQGTGKGINALIASCQPPPYSW